MTFAAATGPERALALQHFMTELISTFAVHESSAIVVATVATTGLAVVGRNRKASRLLSQAIVLKRSRQYDESYARASKAVEQLMDTKKFMELKSCYLLLGDIEAVRNHWDAAITNYSLAGEAATAGKNFSAMDPILLALGRAYQEAGRIDEARGTLGTLIDASVKRRSPGLLAQAHAALADVETKLGHPDVAIGHLESSLMYQELLGSPDLRADARAHESLGDLFKGLEKNDEAADHYAAAITSLKKIPDEPAAAAVRTKMAVVLAP